MGYAACQAATGQPQGDGCVGAGVGATVGKLLGIQQATKGGLGTSFLTGPQGLHVGALAVVNAFGDVVDPETGGILAGARRDPTSHEFINTVMMLRQGIVRTRFAEPNTTIGVVATNARLTREQAQKVAQMGHNALARCIRPVHTLFDGDTVFVLAHPEVDADLHVVGVLAEAALEQAILGAVKSASGLGVLPAYQDIHPDGGGASS
jgi:L-aminopeptidase/D-esterase-like protein